MRCCGVDIAGSDLFLAIVDGENGSYNFVPTKPSRISLENDEDQDLVRSFFETITTFIRVNNVGLVAIKKRATKGPYAGGSITFKIEGLLQIVPGCKVALHAAPTIAAKNKSKRFIVPVGVFAYQRGAFHTACCALT